jgi:metal-sulfur cluster biosynthetic enzyme
VSSRFATVTAALDTVLDPELDEPITKLGFVASSAVTQDGVAEVRLQLPTFFCAPNFAYLMVADAHEAVSAVEGVVRADVKLENHLAADAINEGVAAGAGFAGSFGDQAAGELDELRANFLRKAVLAGTDRVCRPLLAGGTTPDQLIHMTLGSAPDSPDLVRLRARRAELGLPSADDDPLLIDTVTGMVISAEMLPRHLRRAQITRIGIDANSGICRGQLAYRHGRTHPADAAAEPGATAGA